MIELFVRLILLIGVFAAVFLLSQVLLGLAWRNRQKFSAINRRLEMIAKGEDREEIVTRLRKNAPQSELELNGPLARPARAFQRMMFAANLPISAQQLLLLIGVLFAVLFIFALLGAGMAGFGWTPGVIFLLLVITGGLAVVFPLAYVSMRAQARRKQVEEQFPVALDVFVRALRSGHPIAAAIELLTEELEDPIGSEFGIVADEVAYGADLTEALDAMAERWDNPDMRMFVVSLAVQRETGGNLAEILESLARVIRERAVMYMKVRALSAEGRLTGLMLTVLPVFTLIGMFLVNPSFYLETALDPIFIFGFSFLILLFLAGVLWIRRLTDLKV
ncbi:type II secretion system F family protein [Aurantiacibacter sp. MUD11]|uniref:type II secretion system F family protein n=1 Tax=Aurantiacibacter sp. MUD11 TaxID=3003265 RepID=UPI0022AAB4D1|nr:type II secretion system F family protein [Aurantiacibacter sp. MUD11]WAT16706.1 type II secretion system F family protein [Aurantiacibacter sp. MUD11]